MMGNLKMDPVSGVPLLYISLAVRYFFPDTDLHRQGQKQRNKIRHYPGQEAVPDEIIFTGSTAEDLDIPYLIHRITGEHLGEADIDTMMSIPLFELRPVVIEDSSMHRALRPGYCYLRLNMTKEELDLSGSILKYHVSDINGKLYINTTFVNVLVTTDFKAKMKHLTLVKFLDVPNLDLAHPAVQFTMLDRDSDLVTCFPVDWPEIVAFSYLKRKRKCGWPSTALMKELLTSGCHLVSKSHPLSPSPGTEWRFSFSYAELCIARTLSRNQKLCYKVFKALIKNHKATRGLGIATYYLKTTFFWLCEELPPSQWTYGNLGPMLLYLLDKLLYFVQIRNLPHYFIPENNIVEHIPQRVIKQWSKAVRFIRENPLQAMEDFHLEHTTKQHFGALLGNVCNGITFLRMQTVGSTKNAQEKIQWAAVALEMFGLYYGSESYHGMVQSIGKTSFSEDSITSKQPEYILHEVVTSSVEEELENLKRRYVSYIHAVTTDTTYSQILTRGLHENHRSSVQAILHADLACILHQLSQTLTIVDEGLSKEAEHHFLTAVDCDQCPWSVTVKYAQYLVVKRRYTEALPIIQSIINTKEPTLVEQTGTYLCYSKYTYKSLETTLRITHSNEDTEILYQAHALAYYLLLICLKEVPHEQTGINIPSITEYHTRFSKTRIAVPLVDLIFLEGCFLLRYGYVHKALCVFLQTGEHWRAYYYIWYCVAKLFCSFTAEMYERINSWRSSPASLFNEYLAVGYR